MNSPAPNTTGSAEHAGVDGRRGVLTFPRSVYRDDHEMFRETARRFAERECKPRQAEWDAAGRVDRETWLKAGREGLLCMTLPEEYGGAGGDFGHSAVFVEELAYAGVVGPAFSLQSDIVAPYILRNGSPEQKRKWLPGCASGEVILAIAMSEPGAGSDMHSRPSRPALRQVSRSTRPAASHSAWRGLHSRCTKRRAVSRNISWSSR